MMQIDKSISFKDLSHQLDALWEISGKKILKIEKEYDHTKGSPVFTSAGKYTTRGWTEWTQGFEYGSSALQFEASGNEHFLELARNKTLEKMAPHVTHFGVHDHGFNNVSTYGNLLRQLLTGHFEGTDWEADFYRLALKLSGASQARRWTNIEGGGGFIYSFNGPHSLFVDTIRSCRSLAVSYLLGHKYMDEGDQEISLIGRLLNHAISTAEHSVYYGEDRDQYDTEAGRTTHEAIFNTNDGQFRCPNSQQGFSGFTTWTRGLAWAITGFAEELEFLELLSDVEIEPFGDPKTIRSTFLKAAHATSTFYINNTPADGIPYWDTGAPGLTKMSADYLENKSNPYNDHEPIDSSAAAIAAQGLIRLGQFLGEEGNQYTKAGITIAKSLFSEPYLSTDQNHHGLILHSIYHRPNGWDYVPDGSKIPNGESSMWGDYHARELALYIGKLSQGENYHFFDCAPRN
ncbi:MAG: glycosyl hydrolase [Verrucomicrobiales bacterium]|nr:glycosyl hydrolase [Verrucomicrobiales bacterium]